MAGNRLDTIGDRVVNGKRIDALAEIDAALAEGLQASRIMTEALIPAMSIVGEKYSTGEFFLPQMMIAAKAMSECMRHIGAQLAQSGYARKGKVVLGTVAGDFHDIGKNIVKLMLEGNGWELVDLGVDVRPWIAPISRPWSSPPPPALTGKSSKPRQRPASTSLRKNPWRRTCRVAMMPSQVLNQAIERAGIKFQVGFMRRFDPAYAMARKMIDEGLIGQPVMFKATSRDPRRTSLEFARRENSGGMILDMGVHDFDLARWLMSSEVERVQTEGSCAVYPELKDVGDIDNAVINLRFANGAIGNIDLSRNAVYGYDIRTEVLCSEGGLLMGKWQQTSTLMMTRNGITHDTVPYFMERFGEAYAEEIRDFVRCILEDRPPAVSGQDARAATAIGVAATLSLDEGRPVLLREL